MKKKLDTKNDNFLLILTGELESMIS